MYAKISCAFYNRSSFTYLTYLAVSISGAISIPFILIALNQDRIAEFLKNHGKPTATVFIVLSLAILLSVIWTRDLAPGMKAAVTVFIVLLTILALAVRSIYLLFNKLHANKSISTYLSSCS